MLKTFIKSITQSSNISFSNYSTFFKYYLTINFNI